MSLGDDIKYRAEIARENIKKLFKDNPDLAKAFKESLEELKKPENIEKMANDTCKFMEALKSLQRKVIP